MFPRVFGDRSLFSLSLRGDLSLSPEASFSFFLAPAFLPLHGRVFTLR